MISRSEYLKLPKEKRFVKLSTTEDERATALHSKLVTVDMHIHVFTPYTYSPPYAPPAYETVGMFSPIEKAIDGIRESGLTCFFEKVCPNESYYHEDYWKVMENVGQTNAIIDKYRDIFMRAFCAEDIRRAKREGKTAVVSCLETSALGNGPVERVDTFYGLGIKSQGLCYDWPNYLVDRAGLTKFGEEVVARMNNLGMIIDFSHPHLIDISTEAVMRTIEISKDPITFDHAACQLPETPGKFKTDDELKALAEKGGLVGILAVPNFLSKKKTGEQGIQDMLDHIDYAVKLIGVDYVGIGTDTTCGDHVGLHRLWAEERMRKGLPSHFPSGWPYADYFWGLENFGEWPNVIRGLVSRGYSDQEIEKIVGGNALRLIERVIG